MLKLTDKQIHLARTAAANWCNASRKAVTFAFMLDRPEERALRGDGIAVVPDFLPDGEFHKIRDEAHQAVEIVEANVPIRQRSQPVFGPQQPNAWGFDRYHGGTLNRFVGSRRLTIYGQKKPWPFAPVGV
jgi:hypothetical protein